MNYAPLLAPVQLCRGGRNMDPWLSRRLELTLDQPRIPKSGYKLMMEIENLQRATSALRLATMLRCDIGLQVCSYWPAWALVNWRCGRRIAPPALWPRRRRLRFGWHSARATKSPASG